MCVSIIVVLENELNTIICLEKFSCQRLLLSVTVLASVILRACCIDATFLSPAQNILSSRLSNACAPASRTNMLMPSGTPQ
jgi:hypothetical protein